MKRLIFFGVLVVLILGTFATAVALVPGKEVPPVREAIEAANEQFMAAFAAHDAAALAAFYTEDAKLMPPNSDILEGRAAIQAFWQAVFDMGIDSALLQIVEVDALGNTAVEVSHFWLYTADGQVADYGKYMIEWKRVRGQWFLHRDIWNTSQPLTP
jgi:uncharacterized protein (TIGR02246 family)